MQFLTSAARRRLVAAVAIGLVAAPLALSSAPAQAVPSEPGTPSALLRWTGDISSATGAALSSGSCDVNGDDYADAVVGAWFWDKAGAANTGATYVLLGGTHVNGASLADPTAAGAVRIDGPATANAFTGFAVGCLGDVNGDGIDDLGISHYTTNKAYVLFGAKNFTAVDLGSLGDRGFVVKGDATSGNLGFSLAGVGDLNHDGLDDFGVAEVVADTRGRTNNGRVWVIAGRDDISDVDVLAPTSGQVLLTVDGATSEERLGNVANVGDVNGDGVDDLLLGSYTATPWGSSVAVPGAAYVVWGGGEDSAVDLASLGNRGFTINGPKRQRDRLGISVAGAGDVNGDGKADLVLGADGVTNAETGPRTGGAAIVYGSASTARVYTDPTATTSVYTCSNDPGTGACTDPLDVRKRGYWISGAVTGDAAGYSVAGIGDVDGDGVPDQLLGAYGYDPVNPETQATMSGAGAVYVVHGNKTATNVSLGALDPTTGYRIDGLKAGDRFGRQVAGLGDVDGNGTADFVAGADFAARPGAQNGEVTVALLGDLATTTTLTAAPTSGSAVGDWITATATVSRDVASATAPAGTVDFTYDGAAACTEVTLTDGAATCQVQLSTKGGHQLLASYGGADLLGASASSPVTVAAAPLGTTVTPLATSPTSYGSALSLGAVVAGPRGIPTGTVRFALGSKVLGTATVNDDGTVFLQVPARVLRPGSSTITLNYSGDSTHDATTSTSNVRVDRAAPRVGLRLAKGNVARGKRGAAVVRVSAPAGVPVTGTLTVLRNGKAIKSVTLRSGKATVALPKLARGKHRIRVVYSGSDLLLKKTSTAVVLRVR